MNPSCGDTLVSAYGFFFFSPRDAASTEPFRSLYIASYPSSCLPFSPSSFFLSLGTSRESLLMQVSPCLPFSVLSCFHPRCSWIWGWLHRFLPEGMCSATSTCQWAGQLLLLKDVIYNRYICLRAFDFGLKTELSGERIDLSWNTTCSCSPNILCLWSRIIQLKRSGNLQR